MEIEINYVNSRRLYAIHLKLTRNWIQRSVGKKNVPHTKSDNIIIFKFYSRKFFSSELFFSSFMLMMCTRQQKSKLVLKKIKDLFIS